MMDLKARRIQSALRVAHHASAKTTTFHSTWQAPQAKLSRPRRRRATPECHIKVSVLFLKFHHLPLSTITYLHSRVTNLLFICSGLLSFLLGLYTGIQLRLSHLLQRPYITHPHHDHGGGNRPQEPGQRCFQEQGVAQSNRFLLTGYREIRQRTFILHQQSPGSHILAIHLLLLLTDFFAPGSHSPRGIWICRR